MNKDGDMNISFVFLRKTLISCIKNYLSVLFIYSHLEFCIQVSTCLFWQLWLSWSPFFLIKSCSYILSPSRFSLSFIWTPSRCISWHSHPHLCQWLLSWKCYRRPRESPSRIVGLQGLGWRVTMGVGSQWGFSFYRLQWRQNLLGKVINGCLFVFLSVRLLVSTGLLTCLSV